MRRAHLSLVSFVLASLPLACTLEDGSSSSSCYDTGDCGYPSGGSYVYDAGGPDSGCAPSLAIAVEVAADSGDCRMSLAAYEGYASDPSAIYFFPAPQSGETKTPCEALASPAMTTCERAHDVLTLASTDPDQIASLESALGVYGDASSFYVEVTCARSGSVAARQVKLGCAGGASNAAPDDAGPGVVADAGVADASKDASPSADAAPAGDGGCGP